MLRRDLFKSVELTAKEATEEGCELSGFNVSVPEFTPGVVMYMPGGIQEGTFGSAGGRAKVKVLINRATADTLNKQHAALCAKSEHKPYFDFNHEDGEASFWPQKYEWRDTPKPAVYSIGEYSGGGEDAVKKKTYRALSPVFWVNDPKGNPAQVVCNPNARLNMGGLVNAPAFKNNSPLFAKDHSTETSDSESDMKKTLAELTASVTNLTAEIGVLVAKNADDAETKQQIANKRMELQLAQAQVQLGEFEAKETTRKKTFAKKEVEAAVKAGKIKPGAKELIAKYEGLIESDESNVVLLAGLPVDPALGENLTEGQPARRGELQAKEGLSRTIRGYGKLVEDNSKIQFGHSTSEEKFELATRAALFYAKDLSGQNIVAALAEMRELSAADNTDANLGVLSGTLVAQRTIELFRLKFPLIKKVWTDFSEIPAKFNQVVETRVVIVPAVQAYDATLDANGEPKGWITVAPAQTKDVPVKLDELIGCPIRFGMDTLSSTIRRLFDEQAPGAAYAMAKYFVQKIYKLWTPANYNAYAAVIAGKVPDAYATFPVALGDFARSSLTKIESIFDQNEVPEEDRFVVLNAKYYAQLGNDPSITQFYAATQDPEIITETRLPKMAGFDPIKAPNLTANNNTPNLVGMAGHRGGTAILARMPIDLNQVLPGAQSGSVITMTDAELGIPWQLVQFVKQDRGYAQWQLQTLMGAAVADNRGGLPITSQ